MPNSVRKKPFEVCGTFLSIFRPSRDIDTSDLSCTKDRILQAEVDDNFVKCPWASPQQARLGKNSKMFVKEQMALTSHRQVCAYIRLANSAHLSISSMGEIKKVIRIKKVKLKLHFLAGYKCHH